MQFNRVHKFKKTHQWDLDGTCPDQIEGATLGSVFFGSSEFSGDLTLENEVLILDQFSVRKKNEIDHCKLHIKGIFSESLCLLT